MMGVTLGLLLLISALLAPAEGQQQTSPLVCVQQQKTALATCQAHARGTCESAFRTSVPPCFGTASACATACLADQAACLEGPNTRQVSCQQICTDTEKESRRGCARSQNSSRCNISVKLRGLKCRQHCQRAALPTLQGCNSRFDSCLKTCAGAS